ncbi:MAG: thioredoxin family protein [Alphaproteobacteria bacterium]|nr:thioredoxin family protein [Alphaproteobacteria bacterium]MBU2084257.1 thioredoxin family protein [Alphaproteobacteria bacterium]MBU2141395.1 thioredoxin family protein [Alphaproteobacteria bacterium]MBU2197333.1 thioredoxin family protein [Alphaproteobacteria bacterium]
MIRIFASILAVLLIGALAPATAAPVDGGHARVELIAERSSVLPGETIYAALKMDLDPNWHVYWRNAGDAGLPPELIYRETSTVPGGAIGDFVWPVPHLLPVVEGEIMDYGYSEQVILPFPLMIPANASGTVQLDVVADYLICEDICVPETADVSLTLRVGQPVPDTMNGEMIAQWIAKVPLAFVGDVRVDASGTPWKLSLRGEPGLSRDSGIRFFPFAHEISHPAPQPVTFGSDGATLSLTQAGQTPLEGNLDGVLVIEQADGTRFGYEISAEQGPVFENTAGLAAIRSGKGGAGGTGLLTLAFFALIGGLILNLMPCVLPVLSIKAMGMVSAAASGHANELRSHGIWYTVGVLVSFAALAGAIVGVRAATGSATLGFQLQNGPTVAILALIMFLIGLWLMGLFELGTSIQNTGSTLASRNGAAGAFFTGVLAAVVGAPCVGPFLGAALGAVLSQPAAAVFIVFLAMGFGLALPFLLLSFVPGLQRVLPKPGKWMETLKQFFAFPMFLTAAWLLSVLGALSGHSAVAWTVAGATAITFAIWLARRGGVPARAVAAAVLVVGFAYPALRASAPAAAEGTSSAYAAKYETEAWSPERVAELTAQGRPVFVDFTATWCATCQLNKLSTLKSAAVQDAFADANVAFLVADFTRKDPVIAEELKRRERAGVPMYLWYPAGASEPEILPEILSKDLVIGLLGSS